MPSKSLLFDAAFRNGFVCRSCMTTLRAQHATTATTATTTTTGLPRSYYKVSAGKEAADKLLKRTTSRLHPRSARKAPRDRIVPVVAEQKDNKGYSIRYFEQDRLGQRREIKVEKEEEEEEEENGQDDDDDVDLDDLSPAEFKAHLNRKLKVLESTLESLFKTDKLDDFLEPKISGRDEQTMIEKGFAMLERDGMMTAQIDSTGLRHGASGKIKCLNDHLLAAARAIYEGKVSRNLIKSVWREYRIALDVILDKKDRVSRPVWDTFWKLFSWEGDINPNRMAHIHHLARDMSKAGVSLREDQQLLLLEAMFIEGHEKDAIKNWRKLTTTLGSQEHDLHTPYWELGVRMLSLHGEIERAERASTTLFERSKDANPRVLMHLIRACAKNQEFAQKGFAVYRRLRELLGKSMGIEDYDDVISCFLAAGHTNLGLYTFVDMMFAGTVDLYSKNRNLLPTSISNHFFMGKWLKRLIGAGDLDGALGVLVFMQSKGIMAASVQVNGLIGAWLRSGVAENQDKAEELAWAMIRSRKTFVQLRRRTALLEWPSTLLDGRVKGLKQPEGGLCLTFVPRASLETFIIMAQNYKSRRKFRRLEELYVAYKQCEIDGDALLMNQLLEAAVDDGKGETARDLCRVMTEDHNILPDGHTYHILFSSLSVNRIPYPRHTPEMRSTDIGLARQLFRDLLGSSWVFKDKGMHEAQVKLILHTFRKCRDWVGILVVLQALKEIIHFEVSRGVLLEMVAEQENIDRPSKRMQRTILYATRKLEAVIEAMGAANARAMGSDIHYAIMQTYVRPKVHLDDAQLHDEYTRTAKSMGIVSDQYIDWGDKHLAAESG